ncbi:hypothetical protein MKHDV_02178 [Halodesulfovibrio sp. MK-HDV]|jgi:penicillin-insensitive murein DD-endopeptidase|nr:hypothetical protein MKHDV_02178 [Halodesulfovibrio sp. MK-HDV]
MVLSRLFRGLTLVVMLLMSSLPAFSAEESICFGETRSGHLSGGVRLPRTGLNFSAYSDLGWIAGRTYVHSKIAEVVLASYKALQKTIPDATFVYGETGWKSGGSFKPHKTHQNGLSVDFMVPVRNSKGKSVPLPCSVFNKLGYSLEFDRRGRMDDLQIDFEAMTEHIYWLHKKAAERGVKIWRVIFDPALQKQLTGTSRWPYLEKYVQFSTRRSWVRHDEHYHVDFIVKCRANQS